MPFPVRPLSFHVGAPRTRAAALAALGPRPLPPDLQLSRLQGKISPPLASLLWRNMPERGGMWSGQDFANAARRPVFTVKELSGPSQEVDDYAVEAMARDRFYADAPGQLQAFRDFLGPAEWILSFSSAAIAASMSSSVAPFSWAGSMVSTALVPVDDNSVFVRVTGGGMSLC